MRKLLRLPLWQAQSEDLLGPARDALARFGRLSDANAAEISAAQVAAADAQTSVAPAAALFDVLAAARISEEVRNEFAQRGTFWLDNLNEVVGSGAHELAKSVLLQLPPLHFPVVLSEVFLRERPGFDVITGNPPWEKPRPEERNFWSRHQPGFILSASKTKR